MVKLMVGRDLSQFYQRSAARAGRRRRWRSIGLRTPAHPRHELSFAVRAGEIVGVAGLVGAGRTELLDDALRRRPPAVGGAIQVGGQPVALRQPLDAIRAGLALVPEDRKQQGLILEMAVRENVEPRRACGATAARPAFLNLRGRARRSPPRRIREAATSRRRATGRSCSSSPAATSRRSCIGKWLAMNPRVLLLDEPTRGIDVGAKQEIYRLMEELAASGVAILFVSSEMEEVLGMSDRALVMHEGRITGELPRHELSEEAVMHLATGRERPAA